MKLLFTVLRLAQEYITYMETSSLPVLGDLITKDNKNVVKEEPQHLFDINLCVESESWIAKYVRQWLTTKYEYFLLPFLLKKQLSMMQKFFMRYGRIKCCKIIGVDAVNLRIGDFKLFSSSIEILIDLLIDYYCFTSR
jgi:hypothetical protein